MPVAVNLNTSDILFSDMNASKTIDVTKGDVVVITESNATRPRTTDYAFLSGTCTYDVVSQNGQYFTENGHCTQQCITVIKVTGDGTLMASSDQTNLTMISMVKIN